jgi:deoxyribose-phosphate aldolase
METEQQNTRPPLASYEEVARMMDYAVLAPALSEEQVAQACDLAKQYRPGRLTVRAADLDLVSAWMKGSGIPIGTAVAFPHGADTTAVKLYAVRDALARGARFVETVLNLGKVASRQFRYVESELMQMAQECRRSEAELIVDLELAWLPEDLRVIACRIARRAEVPWIRAGSIFGPGQYAAEDLQFLAARLGDLVQLDAGPSVSTLEDLHRAYELGCSGFQTTDPALILDAWTAELKRRAEPA